MKIFEDDDPLFSKIQGVSPQPEDMVPEYFPKKKPVGPPDAHYSQTILALICCPIIGFISLLTQRKILVEYDKDNYEKAWLLSKRVQLLNRVCFSIFFIILLLVFGVYFFQHFFENYQVGIKNETQVLPFLRPAQQMPIDYS